jgi:DNA polymerase-3 subunit beta
MSLSISRELLLAPLQKVSGVLSHHQTLPILGNVLLSTKEDCFSLTATDSEIELISGEKIGNKESLFNITVPGKKFLDIIKALPESSQIQISQQGDRLLIQSGKSRFTLSTLPASDFPSFDHEVVSAEFSLPQKTLKNLLRKTHFAMAQQDVRYYLNGLLLHVTEQELRMVATDAHRLAFAKTENTFINQEVKVIVPRKGILELMRLLEDSDELIYLKFGSHYLQAVTNTFNFTSKLIEGKFPDYSRVIPKHHSKKAVIAVDQLQQALSRAAILSNQKNRGIYLKFSQSTLYISANNSDQEQADEEIAIDYNEADIEFALNVNYLLDILSLFSSEAKLSFSLKDATSGILIELLGAENSDVYVVMPMRL